jgi:hypothetical protein
MSLLRIAVGLIALGVVFPATRAEAAPLPPIDLWVRGGEEAWHPVNRFRLDWQNPEAGDLATAVRYRVHDAEGQIVVAETRIDWPTDRLAELYVPNLPGVYTAEVWLEDALGAEGAPAAAKLRYDNGQPGSATPLAPSGWIGRTAFPYGLRIEHADGTMPVSGILGYAVSIDHSPVGAPCAGTLLCGGTETDLRGGPLDDTYSIPELPDGTSYVHSVAVSNSGVRSPVPGHAALHVDEVDPLTRLSGAPSGWTNQSVPLTAATTDEESGMGPGGGAFTAIQVDDQAPSVAAGNTVRASVIGEGAHSVAYYARDAAGNVNDGAATNGIPNHQPGVATVRIDRSRPRVVFPNAQEADDPEMIKVKVIDPLSGPSPSQGSIGVRRLGSRGGFAPLPTETTGSGLRARWRSDAYPVGEYAFRATGFDAAGNATTSVRRADGTEMVLESPLKAPTSLAAGLGGGGSLWHHCARRRANRRCQGGAVRAIERRPSELVVPYGRGGRFSGRLTTGINTPLDGFGVQIVEHFDGDAGTRVATAETRRGGIFSVRLAPGPSRRVVAVFGGTRRLGRAVARTVRLAVRSRVRMRTSSAVARVGGRPVVFRGRVLAEPGSMPPGGKAVELQFRLPGLPWSEFRTIETDRRGRFRYAYSFSDDDSRGVRFQFRAHAPPQSGWPYEPGDSKPVAVRGR